MSNIAPLEINARQALTDRLLKELQEPLSKALECWTVGSTKEPMELKLTMEYLENGVQVAYSCSTPLPCSLMPPSTFESHLSHVVGMVNTISVLFTMTPSKQLRMLSLSFAPSNSDATS